eukprot:CAMPEP_0194139470 /NCGR_PEP_ID=MMETSP0152-20130528/9106_1 /TAXON_ID=1049557 /ORGANISM="Thalassiothrix antarctica, Strain L6-D1" /LENGTH=116 /DNA_ID=CAMNT_0038837313 /DNA_START=1 /DNA_END=348 /DNA_ORIENTATION=+
MSMVSYVDWGQAMLPRLFGEQRIAGDIPLHYGLEARTMFIQMLINHLIERERQKIHNIPWIDDNNSIQKEDDNSLFMVISEDKRQMYDAAESMFCGSCTLGNKSSHLCRKRRNFVH